MTSHDEQFERFITVVRSQSDIPDGVSITDFITSMHGEYQAEVMRAEVSWDDFNSLLSLRFTEDGKIEHDFSAFNRHGDHTAAKDAIEAAASAQTVATTLDVLVPLLQASYPEVIVVWEYNRAIFAGKPSDYFDNDWDSVEL